MPLRKLCNKAGCNRYADEGHRYCREHITLEQLIDRPDYSKFTRSPLYNSSRWRRTSRNYLLKHPICAMCGNEAEVVDHIIPHRNDADLFWDEGNWQPLCKKCHDKKTREEINSRHKEKYRTP